MIIVIVCFFYIPFTQVVIRGIVGYPGDSDIAIDDISLLDGSADSTTGLLGKCGTESY